MKPQNHLFVAYILLFLLAGCSANRDLIVPPPTNRDLIVLLPDPDGILFSVRVTTKGGSQILDKPGYAAQVGDPSKPPIAPKPIDENEITGVFGAALSAQPDPTGRFISFILWFENDKTKLTDESKELLPEIMRSIQNRKPNEIYVVGHTDLVGTEAYNIELSSRRARHVRDLLVSSGIKSSSLFVSYYGKARPLVPTNDEVPEPRNRRVEVIVR